LTVPGRAIKTGFLAVILLLPAFAAAKTGNELLGDCSVALQHFNHESVSGQADFIKIGDCIGFVSGVIQTATLLKNASPGNHQSKEAVQFCAPPDVSVEQVIRMTLKRLQRYSAELDLDATVVILRALNEGFPETCIEGSGKQAEGLRWPNPPRKARMRLRLVAVALAEPRSSYFSNHEVLIAEKEIGDEEFSLIKLVFTYLPYQPRLEESGFDYSMVHEVSAWRNPDCDETVEQLTERSLPDRHEPMIYSPNAPRKDLDRRRIPLPCYETKADDYIKSSLEPIAPPPPPSRPVLQVHPDQTSSPTASGRVNQSHPTPTPTPAEPVLKVRPTPE
jgi:hypothetical protein